MIPSFWFYLRWGFLTLFLGALSLILAVYAWFLLPGQGAPEEADAVIVLAGIDDGRHDLAATLIEAGVSHHLVVSNPSGEEDRVGSSYCRGEEVPEGAETWCLQPEPVTTTGEALVMGELAVAQEWSDIVVVTNRPHTHRVRTIFRHCTELNVSVVHVNEVEWEDLSRQIAREIGGYLKHWRNRPCVT